MVTNHKGLNITRSGFYVSPEHPLLDATPDGLVECAYCGKGVVEVKCPLCAEKNSLRALADDSSGFCLERNSIILACFSSSIATCITTSVSCRSL